MKKILLIVSMLIISYAAYSQTDAFLINNDGSIRFNIDTVNEISRDRSGFTIHKDYNPYIAIRDGRSSAGLGIAREGWDFSSSSRPGDLVLYSQGLVNGRQGIIFFLKGVNNQTDGQSYIKFGDSYNDLWMGIFNDRKVRIDGEVFAKKITVKTNVWADDVFDSDYQLMTLPEIESYIKAHNHLPDVPCAEEVIEEGINVSEMNALLLRKVEELTLHLIEQNKRMESQENLILQLQKELKDFNKLK